MKVSVAMITYNHEKFIAQAIDSVLMQQTDFDYELVIGEDCSTDRTRQIVIGYQEKYPSMIRTLLHAHNLGPPHSPGKNNFVSTLKACRGQYIALLEGDDYWTNSLKLQKQVDSLDENPGCVICFHNTNVCYDDGRDSHLFNRKAMSRVIKLKDMLEANIIATCSVVFRNNLFKEFPSWYYELPMGDWPLHILNAEHGDAIFLNDVMGVYRINSSGIWSGAEGWAEKQIERLKSHITLYEKIKDLFGYKYSKIIRTQMSNRWYQLALLYREQYDIQNMKKCLWKGFISKPINSQFSGRFFITSLLYILFPKLCRHYHSMKNVNQS